MLLKEIQISRGKRRSRASLATRGYSSKLNDRLTENQRGTGGRGGKFSPETGSRIKEAVEHHLQHRMTCRVCYGKTWKVIDDLSEVANIAPQDLVAALEIVWRCSKNSVIDS